MLTSYNRLNQLPMIANNAWFKREIHLLLYDARHLKSC